jgi:hypothetical protein
MKMNGITSSNSKLMQQEKASAAAAQCSTPTNSLKSSVKRLFSPKHAHNPLLLGSPTSNSSVASTQIITAPSGSSLAGRKDSTASTSAQQQQKRMAPQMGLGQQVTQQPISLLAIQHRTPLLVQKQEALSSASTSSTNSNMITSNSEHTKSGLVAPHLHYDEILTNTTIDDASMLTSLNENTVSSGSNASSQSTAAANTAIVRSAKKTTTSSSSSSSSSAQQQAALAQPRATSTLKKGFNLLKSNSKKVLMGSSSSSTQGHEMNGLGSHSSGEFSVLLRVLTICIIIAKKS